MPRDLPPPALAALLDGFSIEVTPRSAATVADFRPLLPQGTRVCIAHIDGTAIADMLATASRLRRDGFEPMPHFPARSIPDRATLADWLARYRDQAGVRQALVLGGGIARPRGDFHAAMQLLETGLFDGFTDLHVAGHPEGSRDLDPDGSDRAAMAALRLKQDFANRSDARMAIVTQFCFDAAPVLDWAARIAAAGIDLPIRLGTAGPGRLGTLMRYALACGIGPSLQVLKRRPYDLRRLVHRHEPTAMLRTIASQPRHGIAGVHLFPLGGIAATCAWAARHRA